MQSHAVLDGHNLTSVTAMSTVLIAVTSPWWLTDYHIVSFMGENFCEFCASVEISKSTWNQFWTPRHTGTSNVTHANCSHVVPSTCTGYFTHKRTVSSKEQGADWGHGSWHMSNNTTFDNCHSIRVHGYCLPLAKKLVEFARQRHPKLLCRSGNLKLWTPPSSSVHCFVNLLCFTSISLTPA